MGVLRQRRKIVEDEVCEITGKRQNRSCRDTEVP